MFPSCRGRLHLLPGLLGPQRCSKVGQRRRAEIIFQSLADRLIKIVLRAGHVVVALFKADDASIEILWPFHHFHNLHEGNLMSRPRQRKSSAASLGAVENATFDELLEKLGQKIARQIGAGNELIEKEAG